MLSALCLYSANNVFAITGNKDHRVKPIDIFSLPQEVSALLRPGTNKLTHTTLTDGMLALAINNIPRDVGSSFELLFLADKAERRVLDNLTVFIADNLPVFEKWVASLFYGKKSIHCKGDELLERLCLINERLYIAGTLPPYLCNLKDRSGVILQVKNDDLLEPSRKWRGYESLTDGDDKEPDTPTSIRLAELLANTNQARPQLPLQGRGKLKLSVPFQTKFQTTKTLPTANNPTDPMTPMPQPPTAQPSRKRTPLIISVILNILLVLLVILLLASCKNNQAEVESDTVEEQVDQYEHWQNPYPDLTEGQIRQLIITSIAHGDKETFANLVQYPISRDYPLHNIENKEQMIANFDLIFDAAFRDTIALLDSNSWEEVGWRGYMLYHGMLWGEGPVWVINYSSPQEQKLRADIIAREMSALHPSLQGEWEPVDRFLLDDGKYGFARLDEVTTESQEPFRLTIFKKNAKIGDRPALTLTGDSDVQGSIGYTTYYFHNNDGYEAVYSPDYYPEDNSERATFKPFITLTSPNGKETKLTIKQTRYYQ